MKKITLTLLIALLTFYFSKLSAQSTATYTINYTSVWNSTDHGALPGGAHWSNLVGANHNSNVVFLEQGAIATQGIQNVAELGSNSVFQTEVNAAITAGNAEQAFINQPFSPNVALGSAQLNNYTVSENFPLLTLVSMIAPSPDWFIAINSLNLWDTNLNTWKANFSVDVFPYDAGTDDGTTYTSANINTTPRGMISSLVNVSPFGTKKIGTLTVTFLSTTLGVDDQDDLKKVKLFPNPNTTGKLTFSNIAGVNDIRIYDLLGKQLIHVKNNSKINHVINTSNLSKGVYIVKLQSKLHATESRKLIIN